MNKVSTKSNTVKVCKRDVCVEAKGRNADMIIGASVVTILLMGVAAILGATR